MPRTPLHSSIVRLLDCYFLASVPEGFHPRAQEPLTFADSEPEPDIAVVRGARDAYFRTHPTSAELVVEVCVSSESLDRVKLGVYAEAGVPECWLVLAEERALERHTEPKGASYQRVERAIYPAQLASTVLPGVVLLPVGLFGA